MTLFGITQAFYLISHIYFSVFKNFQIVDEFFASLKDIFDWKMDERILDSEFINK